MGISGLTTFINSNCKYYLEEYDLKNCYLVIDGYNIASHLYTWHCKRNDCFGGDYDKYARVVYDFFNALKTCNVTPLIILDGGYEDKKLKTIYSRLKNKIQTAKNLNSVSQGCVTMFPLFLRNLFEDIILSLSLKAVRCDFEADYEIACISKLLDCPVLSYDSDFYIFDVLYIPFSTLEMTTHKIKGSPDCHFMRCQIYRIEKFLKSVGGLKKENLPLLATLLGNDYVKMSVFHTFYSELKLPKQGKTGQQAKILGVIKWLVNESYDSAVTKILSKIKFTERRQVAKQITISTDTYLNSNSEVLQYLNITILPERRTEYCTTFDAEKYLNTHIEDVGDDIVSVIDNQTDNKLDIPPSTHDHIPDWFKKNFRLCQYPQMFMDIICHNNYICSPQVEDYSNISSHSINFSILSAIQKLLLPEANKGLTFSGRTNNGAGVSYVKIPLCSKELPKLQNITSVMPQELKQIFFDILDIPNTIELNQLLHMLPDTWQLYFIAILYWIKNSSPKATNAHVYAVILCVFVLNKIDPQIGCYRSTRHFMHKFSKQLDALVNSQTNVSSSNAPVKDSFTFEECLLSFKELIEYFQMPEKMRYRAKLFDVRIIDCFAQFQSCLLHIRYLNILLNKPYCNFIISEFYDGTFLYNMCLNLYKRNIDAYLSQTLLKFSPNFLNSLRMVIAVLMELVSNNLSATKVKRRKKRRRKSVTDDTQDCISQNEGSDGSVDINNRFSVLSLLK